MNTDALARGAEIRARRERLYLTQRELASLAECSLPMIGHFEGGVFPRGNTSPALERVVAVLDDLEAAK